MPDDVMTFTVSAHRDSDSLSTAQSKDASVIMDTSAGGLPDAFNPVELLLASLAACMIKGINRVSPTLNFTFNTVNVALVAHRPSTDAHITDIEYTVTVATPDGEKLDLLHKNVRKFGTISNTVGAGTVLHGTFVAA